MCVALLGTPGRAMDVSPIAKIIQMISDLQAKILAEGAESQKVYEEFAEFCEHRSKDLQYDIKTGWVTSGIGIGNRETGINLSNGVGLSFSFSLAIVAKTMAIGAIADSSDQTWVVKTT